MRRLLPFALTGLLMGCGENEVDKAARLEREANHDLLIAAQVAVESQLRDPSSAVFENVNVYRSADGAKRVCGFVNSNNAFGGKTGPKAFVASESAAFIAEGENEIPVLAVVATACTEIQPSS